MLITYMILTGYGDDRTSHEKEWVNKSRKAFQKSKSSQHIHFQQDYYFSPKYKRKYFRQVLALPSPFDMEWEKMTNITLQVNLLFFSQKLTQHLLNDFLDISKQFEILFSVERKILAFCKKSVKNPNSQASVSFIESQLLLGTGLIEHLP